MSELSRHCVIVGAGHGAAELCASLRRLGWTGAITMVGDEPSLPYHRPPLSKAQLADDAVPLQLIRSADFYRDRGITVLSGQRVDAIDRAAKTVQVGAMTLAYDVLVLCTGSVHRVPPIKGIKLPGVFSLRTADEARQLREAAARAKRAVIIGAGFIGLEVAASLRKRNIAVTVLELAERVLARTTSPEISAFFATLHRQNGVDLRTGVSVCEIRQTEEGLAVLTSDGQVMAADLVVVGAGVAANSALAEAAGLEVHNGVVVNEFNQSSDPAIYAIGDCCNQFNGMYQQRLRLESVQNAVDQAKTAAQSICAAPVAHTALPWFWSDQYDVKLQIAGISTGYDALIVRGTPEPGASFSVWYFRDGKLLAVDAVNDPAAYVVAGKLLGSGRSPDPTKISDTAVPIKDLLTSATETFHA